MIKYIRADGLETAEVWEVYGGTVIDGDYVMYLFSSSYDLTIDAVDYYADVVERGANYSDFLDWMAYNGVWDVPEDECKMLGDDTLYDEGRDVIFKFKLITGYTVGA